MPKRASNGHDLVIRTTTSSYDIKNQKQSLKREKKLVENPQLFAMYEKNRFFLDFSLLLKSIDPLKSFNKILFVIYF